MFVEIKFKQLRKSGFPHLDISSCLYKENLSDCESLVFHITGIIYYNRSLTTCKIYSTFPLHVCSGKNIILCMYKVFRPSHVLYGRWATFDTFNSRQLPCKQDFNVIITVTHGQVLNCHIHVYITIVNKCIQQAHTNVGVYKWCIQGAGVAVIFHYVWGRAEGKDRYVDDQVDVWISERKTAQH